MNTASKVFRSGLITTGAQFVSRIVDFATLIVLARILEPSDFGLVALAMSVILITEAVLELPTYAVLIATRTSDPDSLSTGFTLALIRSGLLTAITISAGYGLGLAAKDPRIFPLVMILSIGPCLRGMQNPKMTIFAQAQNFKPQAVVELVGKLGASFVVISAVLLTGSYWAIAAGIVFAPLVMVIISFWFAPFRPTLTLTRWRMYSRYLGVGVIVQSIRATSWQMDRIILTQFVPLPEIGKYSMASELVAVPVKALIQPLTGPLLAGLSAIEGIAAQRIGRAYLKSTVAILTVLAPLFVFLMFFSEPIVVTILGDKWQASAGLVVWLSAVVLIMLPQVVLNPALLAVGRVEMGIAIAATDLIVKGIAMFILIPPLGVEGAILSQSISAVFTMFGTFYLAKKVMRIGYWEHILALTSPALATLTLGAIFMILNFLAAELRFESRLIPLVFGVIVGVPVYCATVVLLWHFAGRPSGLVSMAFNRFRKN